MSTTIAIPLSDAKTNFSTIIKNVRESGAEYTVLLRNVPVATIAPIAKEPVKHSKTRGLLAHHANDTLRAKEKSAFATAMKEKHAHSA